MLQRRTDLLDETRCSKFLVGFVVFAVILALSLLIRKRDRILCGLASTASLASASATAATMDAGYLCCSGRLPLRWLNHLSESLLDASEEPGWSSDGMGDNDGDQMGGSIAT